MGLILAILSGLAWSGVDASRKALSRHMNPIPVVVLLSVGQLPIFFAWLALEGVGAIDVAAYLPAGLGCAAINLAASLAFVRAVQVSPLSRTIPFLSFTPVFTTAVAYAVLGERPAPVELAGIVAVVLGALVLSLSRRDGRAPLRLERGSLLMIGVSVGWAVTASLDKLALAAAPVPVHALFQGVSIPSALLGLLAATGRTAELAVDRRVAGPLAGAVLCAAAASGLQYVAFTLTLVALVETVKRALGGIMALVLGRLTFGEALTASKLAAVVLMSGGAVALML